MSQINARVARRKAPRALYLLQIMYYCVTLNVSCSNYGKFTEFTYGAHSSLLVSELSSSSESSL